MAVTFLLVLVRVASPDMLFHVMFVLLAVHAFALGFMSATLRLAFAFVAVTVDVFLPRGLELADFLNEWPLMFLIAAVTVLMAQRRQETVNRYVSLYREASDRLLTAQEDERRRLAMDLHDGVGQTITALTLTLETVVATLPPGHPARRTLERSREMAVAALEETRDVAQQLRPARLREIGLAAALRDLAERSGMTVAVDIGPLPDIEAAFDTDTTMGIFRVVQEALGNAARHSGSAAATLEVERSDGSLVFRVTDRGNGFDPELAQERGLGLAGMRERAAIVGGSLLVRSTPGEGAEIRLAVPIPVPERPPLIKLEPRGAPISGS